MRLRRDSDYVVLAERREEARAEAERLQREMAQLRARLDEWLAADDPVAVAGEVADARWRLREMREAWQLALERADAIGKRLPAPEQRAEAEARVRSAVAEAEAATRRFEQLWPELVRALEAAEQVAAQLGAARREACAAAYPAMDEAARFGVGVSVPEPPQPPGGGKYAWLLTQLLAEVATAGEAGDTVSRDLAAARAAREEAA